MQNPLASMRLRLQHPKHSFGMVRKKTDGTPKPHQGWDLVAPVGTPVYAIAEGEIIATTEDVGDYGRSITLAFLESGKWYFAFYAHLSAVLCEEGSPVYRGEQIGLSGSSGNAAGMPAGEHHLHFEIRTSWKAATGLSQRIDPGELLGFEVYQTRE